MVDQIHAATSAMPGAASTGATSGSKPYADLSSIGQDATQFGSARAMPEKEDGGIINKIMGIGTAVAGIAVLARFKGVRALLGRIPGKDKALKFIGEQATKFMKSGPGKSILRSLKNVPVIGKPIRNAYAGIIHSGRSAGARLAQAAPEAAAATGKAATETVEQVAKAVT